MSLKGQSIMLQVDEMDATIRYYEEVLGFKCDAQMAHEWAKVSREAVEIMFSCRYGPDKDQPTKMSASVYIFTNTVDELWLELKDHVTVAYPIETFDFGMREFAIYDCNGYMLQFGQGVD